MGLPHVALASERDDDEQEQQRGRNLGGCEFHARSIAVGSAIVQDSRLQLVKIGDDVTYRHEGQTLRGEVHGWRLCNNGYEHRAIVGSARGASEDEVSLRSILSRFRDKGADRGLIEF